MTDAPLTREFIQQRDARIYQLRATGMSHTDIAKSLDITVRAVTTAIQRQTRKLNREAHYAYPEVLRLELDRLDKLQASVWPLAHHRKATLPDGTEITYEPDLKAVETILKISQERRKLLGMDNTKISLDINQDVRHSMAGAEEKESEAIDHKSETIALISLMKDSRILEEEIADTLLGQLREGSEPIDIADIENLPLAIEPGDG
jgi:hypothetical protein